MEHEYLVLPATSGDMNHMPAQWAAIPLPQVKKELEKTADLTAGLEPDSYEELRCRSGMKWYDSLGILDAKEEAMLEEPKIVIMNLDPKKLNAGRIRVINSEIIRYSAGWFSWCAEEKHSFIRVGAHCYLDKELEDRLDVTLHF